MILSNFKEDVTKVDIKSIVNNLIKNGYVKLEDVSRQGNQRLTYWFK